MPSRFLLLILDGLADRAQPALGGLTPLAAAHTPNLDKVVAAGAAGLYHARSPGLALPSEEAHFGLFGYGMEEFPGRGLLEAMGAGLEISPGEIYLLARLVSLEPGPERLMVNEYFPAADDAEAGVFFSEIATTFGAGGIEASLVRTKGLEGVLCLKGSVSPCVSDTSPLIAGRPVLEAQPHCGHEDDFEARATARALNRYVLWAHQKLAAHPVNRIRQRQGQPPINGLVTQRPGVARPVTPFASRWGLKAGTVAGGGVYLGLGRLLGFIRVEKVPEGDDPGQSLAARLAKAKEMWGECSFIHVHSKAPDEAGHTKDPLRKKEVIESLDRGLGRALPGLLADPELVLAVTADHATPSSGPLIHSGERVPLAVHGPGLWVDGVERFDEVSCAAGALGQLRGAELMQMVLNWLDRAKMQGIRASAQDLPYWPGPGRALNPGPKQRS